MPSTVQPMIITAELPRLLRFYRELLDAHETERYPQDGPTFYVKLRIGDSDLGLVHNDGVQPGGVQRVLISVEVADLDGRIGRVEALAGRVLGPPTDMPWGQRVVHLQDPDGNDLNLTQQL
jgi:predicted enzyme related to lactoylglutathione lyase